MLYPHFSWAWNAKVSVLEAPLFQELDHHSKVVQYLRRGEEIEVYPKKENQLFWKTIDKNGNDSFILGEHIQVYFDDRRELNFQRRIDNTDYRLEEEFMYTAYNQFPENVNTTQRQIKTNKILKKYWNE